MTAQLEREQLSMPINTDSTGQEGSTSLEGYIIPVDPTDPAECFSRTNAYYINSELLMATIDGKLYPLHMCGDTNTGMNWDGCSHGVVDDSQVSCPWTRTGETVTAQACVLDECDGYVLDTTKEPYVLIAQINGQWYIVNVISADGLPDTDDMGYLPCEACCDLGVGTIEATIDGCGDFDGVTFTMYGGSGYWTGFAEIPNGIFYFNLSCSINVTDAEDWAATGGCGNAVAPDTLEVVCNPSSTGTGTGTGTATSTADGRMSGSAEFSNSGCSECSSGPITVNFHSVPGRARDECRTMTRTGQLVTAEACGLDDLAIGDEVILASVPKLSISETGTGTGPTEGSQEHIIQVCRGEGECQPCPPPPPGDPIDCCDLTDDTVPLTLTGTVSVSSAVYGCNCTSKPISFAYQAGSNPPEWHQTGIIDCENATGTSVELSNLSGMVISCSGGTGTGTGGADFFLTPPGCYADPAVESTSGQCEPLTMEWEDIDIQGCCGVILDPNDFGVPILMTVEVSE